MLKRRIDLPRQERVKSLPITHVEYEEVNNCYERALVHMHKMPKIWKVCASLHFETFGCSSRCLARSA